jgi:hypothetical protein
VLLHNGDSWNACVTKRCLLSTVQNNLSYNGFYPTSFPTWEISSPAYIQPLSLFSWSSEHTFPILDRIKCLKRPASCYCSFKPVSVFSVPASVSGYPAPLKTPRRWPDKNPPCTRSGAGLGEGNGFMIWADGKGEVWGVGAVFAPQYEPSNYSYVLPTGTIQSKNNGQVLQVPAHGARTLHSVILVLDGLPSPLYIMWGKYTTPSPPIITSLAS